MESNRMHHNSYPMACPQTQKTKEENQKTKEDEHAFFFYFFIFFKAVSRPIRSNFFICLNF